MSGQFSYEFPRILRRVVQEVMSAGDLKTSLDVMVEQVRKEMRTQVCSVYLKDESRQKYVFMATRG